MPLQPMFTTTSQSPASLRPPRRSAYWSSISLAVVLTALVVVAGCCKNTPPAPTQSVGAQIKEPAGGPPPPAAARPTTKQSCDSCKGVWTKHGLSDVETCVCRTKDAAKVCRDGDDCEGDCLADENGFEVTEPGPPAKGFWKGHCSEFDTTFGCHRTIARGARSRGPQVEDDAAATICVD